MTATSEPDPLPRRRNGLLHEVARRLLRIVGGAGADVAAVLNEREARGETIEVAQKDMILKAARFDGLRVSDVMRPRADIVAIDADSTLGEAVQAFSVSQHSRLPVYRDSLDEPIGLVHVRDVLALMAPDDEGLARAKFTDKPLARLKRDILCVPPSMRLPALLLKMQSSRSHLALVIDEYGGTDGLVSMEDLVEEIIGEIEDEHDDESSLIQVRFGAVEADGRAGIEALQAALSADLMLPEHEDEFDTAAGMTVALAGRVPQRGEILHHPAGLDIEVIDADARRVKRVRIRKLETPAEQAAS